MSHTTQTDLFGEPQQVATECSATLSACRTYRYALWRRWGKGPYAMIIGLNPSTADEMNDDPTIRRCIGFARAWGYDAFCMANLFAYRATNPDDMKRAIEPIGKENDHTLKELAQGARVVVAAWGTHGTYKQRDQWVRLLIPNLHILRLTKNGQPCHPLYLPADLKPQPWAW